MTCALNLTTLRYAALITENRIGRIAFIRAVYTFTSRYRKTMAVFRATLRDKQIIKTVFLVNMGAFRVSSTHALPNRFALRKLFARRWVYLAESNMVAGITHHIALAILEIKRRVYALLLEPHGIAPCSAGILSGNEEVAFATNIGGYHIKCSVIVAYRRRIYSRPRGSTFQRKLLFAVKHVSDLLPMEQITAMEERNTGKILKCAVYQIVIAIHATYARVRMESRNYRIVNNLRRNR